MRLVDTNLSSWVAAPHGLLSGGVYPPLGKYEESAEEARKALGIDPDFSIGYSLLAFSYLGQEHTAEAENALQQAFEQTLKSLTSL
jgi:eukaryotic-like serine/threonine-protein kinase